jgi:hypothetical protein
VAKSQRLHTGEGDAPSVFVWRGTSQYRVGPIRFESGRVLVFQGAFLGARAG